MKRLVVTNSIGVIGFLAIMHGMFYWYKSGFLLNGIFDFDNLRNPLHVTFIGTTCVIYALIELYHCNHNEKE